MWRVVVGGEGAQSPPRRTRVRPSRWTPNHEAERQLILLSAGTAARRAKADRQAELLIANVDFSRLAKTLRSRRLLATLGPRILEHAHGPGYEEFDAAVTQALEAGRRQGAYLQLISLRLMAMLGDAGIRSTALKGPLLAEAIYGDLGRRLSGDIDLLVSPGQLEEAVEVVRCLGYRAPSDCRQQDGLPLLHLTLNHEHGELPSVELHWRVHWYERSFARERLLAPAGSAPGQWRAAPGDELAALLLFYARDGFVDLRLGCDLGAWWDTHGARLPEGALKEVTSAYPPLRPAILAAARAAEKIVGLPAAQEIPHAQRPRVRERVAVRLANPNPKSSQSQIYADIGVIDGLLAPPGGLRAFARRQLLPSADVLLEQAQHGGRRTARSPAARLVGVLARYVRTVSRLTHGAEAPL